MEIAGVEVNPKMLAIGGAAGLGLLALTMKGRGSSDEGQTVTLSPGNGLNWSDVVADPNDRGRLIGPGGPIGDPGPPGAPGLPGEPGAPAPGTTPPPVVDQDGGRDPNKRRPNRRDRRDRRDNDRKDRRDDDRGGGRNNRDPREDVSRRDPAGNNGRDRRDRERDRDELRGRDKPTQPNRQDPVRVDDPRLDDPKRARRREEGRGGLREDRRGDQNGGRFEIDVSGGREKAKGKRANANADGGKGRGGDIGKNPSGRVDAGGGRAKADASGGNGNRTGQAAKQAAKKVLKRKGGEAFAGDDPDYENGHGRRDGRGGAADLEVNTNPSRGGSIGGFFGNPNPLRGPGDVVVVKEGDTLSGLARRVYGSGGAVERLYTLNRDILVGDGVLRAGTRLRV